MSDLDELQRLFEWALGFEPGEREERLLERAGSPEMTDRVLRLLAADSESQRDPEGIVRGTLERGLADRTTRAGQQLGPYRLLEAIGSGGMGTVFLAERTGSDFEQRVAIKVVRDGLFDPQLLERLRVERQILSRLEHPHIARLYDGGTTPDGGPFLVMEYVEGLQIDCYCRQNELGLEARLELFQRVCHAVQAAHRQLVVHRDLKPGNIMVTRDGEPKLLDFGIAKLLGDDQDQATRTLFQAMTPAYASPEQVRGEAITTASDVYSLGAVLYELLTSQRPFELSGASPAQIERLVCDTEPAAPSTTVPRGGLGLKGDLDNIVLRALAKEPERRYGSPQELAEDLRRFLAGLPVAARPDTFGYRARKFLGRHRWPVAAATLLAVTLIAFAVTATLQSRTLARERDVAEQEREKAEAVVDLMVSIFEDADSTANRGLELTAREILERGQERLADFDSAPAVRAAAADALGRVYRNLAEYDAARQLQQRALDDNLALYGESHAATAQSLLELARVERDGRELERAHELAGRALAIRRALFSAPDPAPATALNVLGSILHRQGELEEAEQTFVRALDEYDAYREASAENGENPPEDKTSLSILGNLGNLYIDRGRYEPARELLERSLVGSRDVEGERTLSVAISANNLAGVIELQGDYELADGYYRESIDIREELLPVDHPSLLRVRGNYGTFKMRQGDPQSASEILSEVISILRERGTTGFDLGFPLSNYALTLQKARELDASAESYQESLLEIEREGGKDHVLSAYALNGYARTEALRGNEEAAERLLRRALAVRQAALESPHPNVAFSSSALGEFLLARQRSEEAALHLEAALDQYAALSDPEAGQLDSDLVEARLLVALVRLDQGREAESRQLAQEVLDELEATPESQRPPDEWHRARCLAQRLDCAELAGAEGLVPSVDTRWADWGSLLATRPLGG